MQQQRGEAYDRRGIVEGVIWMFPTGLQQQFRQYFSYTSAGVLRLTLPAAKIVSLLSTATRLMLSGFPNQRATVSGVLFANHLSRIALLPWWSATQSSDRRSDDVAYSAGVLRDRRADLHNFLFRMASHRRI